MNTTTASSVNRSCLSREAAGWIVRREQQPTIKPDPQALLAKSAEPRPGNQRFTLVDGETYVLAELRDGHGLMAISKEYDRMTAGVCDAAFEVSAEDVAGALAETGYQWTQSAGDLDAWQAVASDASGWRCELVAKIIPGGVELQGVLAVWEDDITETSQQAVVNFLIAAHDRVRFARFRLRNREVSAASFASADRVELELPDSVFAVVAACRLVQREVRALADVQVARAYLESFE